MPTSARRSSKWCLAFRR